MVIDLDFRRFSGSIFQGTNVNIRHTHVVVPLSINDVCLLSTVWQVIAATNRVDILDPALLRSGRLDRKIEFPTPNEEARARIMQIHSRKMNVQ